MDGAATDHIGSSVRGEGIESRQATSSPAVICRVYDDVIGGFSDHQDAPRRSAAASGSALRASTTSRQATSPPTGGTGAVISPASVASSVLPMKLAERQRPKSANTSPTIQSPTSGPCLTPASRSSSTRTTASIAAGAAQALKNSGSTAAVKSSSSFVQSRTSPVVEEFQTRTTSPPRMDSRAPHNSTSVTQQTTRAAAGPFMDSCSSHISTTTHHYATGVDNATPPPAPAQPSRQIIYF